MEIQVPLGMGIELLLDCVDFGLGLFVTERIGECEEGGLPRSTKHMLEPQYELVIVVDEVVRLREDTTPLRLGFG